MNTQQLSLDQLEALVKNLEEVDNTTIGVSKKDFELSPEGLNELLKRLAAFDDGKLTARPWNDIKKDFGPI
ncbi:hypothetical protein J2Y45_000894 [Dyadobacter sp. BE34]|uniref:Addiction module component n=1 Tax=Dyadobacter fermentans TaxID=94254 RepID=A0ABU1QR59_9BACT|nr:MULTISPECIES: hypothetical protein [Dyadobacter]MDR6803624.1 hypothetical protein [Dyadobacter fermentans]MDR7041364.1 hypothetical protein [Dyadobacter sp. BE242]MDR7195768.1 hypothetical protein [Dyadobacter sp. BE34]MDR7213688.1 hypothetical protein [Dyadobacter sp. BE31]MDR7261174.1 hypothetical protein [Dyadobacter sp. BE32]